MPGRRPNRRLPAEVHPPATITDEDWQEQEQEHEQEHSTKTKLLRLFEGPTSPQTVLRAPLPWQPGTQSVHQQHRMSTDANHQICKSDMLFLAYQCFLLSLLGSSFLRTTLLRGLFFSHFEHLRPKGCDKFENSLWAGINPIACDQHSELTLTTQHAMPVPPDSLRLGRVACRVFPSVEGESSLHT